MALAPNDSFLCTIDCKTPKHPLTATRLIPFEASYDTMSIVTPFHGMLCVGIATCSQDNVEYSHLILWNPLMGEYKTLSIPGSFDPKECYKKNKSPFGLYYTSSDDDYKLLRVTDFDIAYIYSLKSDTWRKVRQPIYDNEGWLYGWFSDTWEPNVLLNEQLYFLKQERDGICTQNSYTILMFDTKTEKFRAIAAPSFKNRLTTCSSFMVHRDRIHLCVTVQIGNNRAIFNDNVELWRMDGDGDWTKVLNYRPMSLSMWYKWPTHLMRNGNWLMHSGYVGRGLVELDMEKQTIDVVSPNINRGSCIPQRAKYIETIVSPNKFIYQM